MGSILKVKTTTASPVLSKNHTTLKFFLVNSTAGLFLRKLRGQKLGIQMKSNLQVYLKLTR